MKPVAVIDIGSNTVRLVIYDGLRRTPTAVFNEKSQCELGRGLSKSGAMLKETMAKAYDTLRRFRLICDQHDIEQIVPLATAAVRDAKNGKEFVDKAEKLIKADIRVLSGEEEAHLTGLGVCYSFHEPTGMVCDMGGGSLEIIEARDGWVLGGNSLPIGTLRLADFDIEKADTIATEQIADLPRPNKPINNLFLVGGGWRALARVYIVHRRYPIRILHQFEAPSEDLKNFIEKRILADRLSMKVRDEIPRNRQATLPYSALVLRNLIDYYNPETVSVSAHGIREGALFDKLKKKDRKRDPLISRCKTMAKSTKPGAAGIDELAPFVDDFLASIDTVPQRVKEGASILSDIAWAQHPSYRAMDTFYSILHAPFIGISHRERAILALAVYYRYGGDDDDLPNHVASTLTRQDVSHAQEIGALLRLAHAIRSYGPGLVGQCRLEISDDRMTLKLPEQVASMVGNSVRNRFKGLSKLRGSDYDIVTFT